MKESQRGRFPGKLLHGGDYNPDQWLERPDILEEDIRLMKKAHVNCVSLGIFSWAALEPSEGEYSFGWLRERIDGLYEKFFEASSIRKINGRYYFVYSSVRSHELCYAVSDRPDGGYAFGGTLVDIGNVFLGGRTEEEAENCLGNTHGGIECCDGQWYVFYHRQTNRTQYSRQGCAEKICFDEEGHIAQAEVTSCGLNAGPLPGTGKYPAYIACHLTRGVKAVFSHPGAMKEEYPYLTQDCKDTEPCRELEEPVQYIHNIKDGSCIGYRYFLFQGMGHIALSLRGKAKGKFQVMEEEKGEVLGEIPVEIDSAEWRCVGGDISVRDGVHPLFFFFQGEGMVDMISFELDERKED